MLKIVIFGIFLILLLPGLVVLSLQKKVGVRQVEGDRQIYIYEERVFIDSFVSPENNLNSVVIRLKNSFGSNKEEFNFSLIKDGQKIREVKVNGYNIGDDDWVRFAFAKIEETKDKRFEIELGSPKAKEPTAIKVFVDGQYRASLMTYHDVDSRLQMAVDMYRSFLNKFIKDKNFLFVWSALLCMVLLGVIKFSHYEVSNKTS